MSAYKQRAEMLHSRRRYGLAVEEMRKHLASDPQDASGHALLGILYCYLGNQEQAFAAVREAIRLGPNSAYCMYALAWILMRERRYDDARKAIHEARRIDPQDVTYIHLQSTIELLGEFWVSAQTMAEQGLRVEPDHTGCALVRAAALVKLGRAQEAQAALREVLRVNPQDAWAHEQLGDILAKQENPAAAAAHYREALCQDPERKSAHYGLTEALKQEYSWFASWSRFRDQLLGVNAAFWGMIGGVVACLLKIAFKTLPPAVEPLVWAFLGVTLVVLILAIPMSDALVGRLVQKKHFGRKSLPPSK